MTFRDFLWFAVGMSVGILGMIAYNEYYDLHPVYYPPKDEFDYTAAFMNVPHSDATLLFSTNEFTISSIILFIGLSILIISLLLTDDVNRESLWNVGLGMLILGSLGFLTIGLLIFILWEQYAIIVKKWLTKSS